ncbi:MAG: DUF3732 domain-containing protein [Terracidiphilus sp.]|jgi:hypothetical protein
MMQILSLAIYSKSGAIERWNLRTGAVNIFTGSRRTGKTALLEIVEYCLGYGECEINDGSVIRNFVEWYGLHLQIGQTQAVVVRRNPPRGTGTSSEIYLEIGSDLSFPALVDLRRTVDIEGLIATLGDFVGITDNLFTPAAGRTSQPLEANFKHARPYLFQRQDEVASPSFLFHREKEDQGRQQAIKDTLPYFMGVVKEGRFGKQEELRRLRREVARLRRRLEEDEWLRREALARGKSLVAAAQELGIYTNTEIPDEQEMVIRILKQISAWEPASNEYPPGLAVDRLQEERSEMLATYRELSTSLDALSAFAGSQSLFAGEISEQHIRLQSIELLKSSDDGAHCPLCQSLIPDSLPTTEELNTALAEVTLQLDTVSKERARLDRIMAERSTEISILRQKIRDKATQIDAALVQNAQLLKRRELDNRRAQAVGRVSLYLEGLDTREEQKDIRALLDEFEERVSALEEELGEDDFDLDLTSISNLVSEPLTKWSKGLDIEYSGCRHRFDARRLTVVAETPTGAITMGKMGPGTNALGNHMLALFGLHSWFAKRDRPVPAFLMLDQISQVYYPSDQQGDPKEDDRLKVKQLYEWLFARVAELDGKFQLIITDHADLNEKWFQDAVVARWRGGRGMVPQEWQTTD